MIGGHGFDLNDVNEVIDEGLISELDQININEKDYYDDNKSNNSNDANEFPLFLRGMMKS